MYQGSCWHNSAAVSVPKIVIKQLGDLKVTGTAALNGKDTLVMTNAGKAYSTSGKDSVLDLATAWTANEFNVVGDGGGSEAKLNTGSRYHGQHRADQRRDGGADLQGRRRHHRRDQQPHAWRLHRLRRLDAAGDVHRIRT